MDVLFCSWVTRLKFDSGVRLKGLGEHAWHFLADLAREIKCYFWGIVIVAVLVERAERRRQRVRRCKGKAGGMVDVYMK
jgi:hypothetical protein